MPNPPLQAAGYMTDTAMLGTATFTDQTETVPALLWPTSNHTYARMRKDPQLTAVLNATTLPLRATGWWVDPEGVRPEVAQLIADDLGLPIKGADPKPQPARRRGVRWEEHLRIALQSLVYGHMPFAQQYEIDDHGFARLVRLSERLPQTLDAINVNDQGDLIDVLQFGEIKLIPAHHLTWYCHEREGAAWQGNSVLRPAYGAWLLKHEMWRVLATSSRRFGMGVPNVQAPPGALPNQLAEAARLAASMRVGDQSGVGLPHGFTLALTGLTGSLPETLEFIRYLDQQMAQMALVSVLNLDASPNGSRALGETFVDLLQIALDAVGSEIANTATGLSVQMVDYNWGEDEPAPRIVADSVKDKPEATAEALQQLMASGALAQDPALEEWVRTKWGLPERSEPRQRPPVMVPGGPTPTDPDAPAPTPPVAAKGKPRWKMRAAVDHGEVSLRRQLTELEAASKADFERIQLTWQDAVSTLVSDWDEITEAQRGELVDQIKAAVDDGEIERLADLSVDSAAAAILLMDRMAEMAIEAADQQAKEARDQGRQVPVGVADAEQLAALAGAFAGILAAGYANAAGKHAVQSLTPTATGGDIAKQTGDHLAGLSAAYLTENLGAALTQAQNLGRIATLAGAPKARYVASEALDVNSCSACVDIDGHEYASFEEMEADYGTGGYLGCKGRTRCRGVPIAIWD